MKPLCGPYIQGTCFICKNPCMPGHYAHTNPCAKEKLKPYLKEKKNENNN